MDCDVTLASYGIGLGSKVMVLGKRFNPEEDTSYQAVVQVRNTLLANVVELLWYKLWRYKGNEIQGILFSNIAGAPCTLTLLGRTYEEQMFLSCNRMLMLAGLCASYASIA